MSAGQHDSRLGTGRNRVVAVTYEEGGTWHPFVGGILNFMDACSLMTAHGRIWDRRRGGYRPGVIARDGRKFFRRFQSGVKKAVMRGADGKSELKGVLWPSGCFVGDDGSVMYIRGVKA